MTVANSAIPMFVALPVLFGFVVNAVNLKAATTLEIRLAEEEPAATLVEAAVVNSDKKVYLHQEAVITSEDMIDVRVVPDGEHFADFNLGILFTRRAANITVAAETHVGKPIAILVNGTVVAVPTLRGIVLAGPPLGAAIPQSALIVGGFTKERADEIAAVLTGR